MKKTVRILLLSTLLFAISIGTTYAATYQAGTIYKQTLTNGTLGRSSTISYFTSVTDTCTSINYDLTGAWTLPELDYRFSRVYSVDEGVNISPKRLIPINVSTSIPIYSTHAEQHLIKLRLINGYYGDNLSSNVKMSTAGSFSSSGTGNINSVEYGD